MKRSKGFLLFLISFVVTLSIYFNLFIHREQFSRAANLTFPLMNSECFIHFIVAGSYSSYNPKNIIDWVRHSNSVCTVNIVRPPQLQNLNIDEQMVLSALEEVPVAQADFMKFLLLYYRGGLVTDFDTRPLKRYPHDWPDCDLVFGIETDCVKDCGSLRPGQIQTWALHAKPKHKFIRYLIGRVVDEFHLLKDIQEISGSYIFDVLRDDTPIGTLKDNPRAILRLDYQGDSVCIAGRYYSGFECDWEYDKCLLVHEFEGTWKKSKSRWFKLS